MSKITFMGAGSTAFAKNVLGDCLLTDALRRSHISLYDIDSDRLKESHQMITTLNNNINEGRATITAHLGVENRKEALRDSKYVINAIQVGGYDPCTITDFEIPKKYGLKQTIGDTLGIGGIFRGLRTIPVMLEFARDMEEVCPDAWLLNYTNPMSILTGAMLQGSKIKTIGLCHSVQVCAKEILKNVDLDQDVKDLRYDIAGINHMAWLLSIRDGDKDLYPEIKKRAAMFLKENLTKTQDKSGDMIRMKMMMEFGYYITESSEHLSEYSPYWIKHKYPELIADWNIPLDEYPRRCIQQIEDWKQQSKDIIENPKLTHERSREYGASIIEAMETDVPCKIGGNVINDGLIPNLPYNSVVEVPCMVDANGVRGCHVGDLPEQLAALNRTNINPQLLTIKAALTCEKKYIYHAAMLDPHTSAELSIDDIKAMCDELIEAHADWLPEYK